MQALIVAPSRELAMQILRTAQAVLPPAAKGAVQQCIGGANVYRQVCAVRQASKQSTGDAIVLLQHRCWGGPAGCCEGPYPELYLAVGQQSMVQWLP